MKLPKWYTKLRTQRARIKKSMFSCNDGPLKGERLALTLPSGLPYAQSMPVSATLTFMLHGEAGFYALGPRGRLEWTHSGIVGDREVAA